MKIKILKFVDKKLFGFMVNYNPGQIIAVEPQLAHEMVEKGYADYEI